MRRRLAPPFAPALLLLLLLAGCASHRGGRLARKLDALGEALGLGAALCGGGLALLLLGGGVATLVWNRRRPSARSRLYHSEYTNGRSLRSPYTVIVPPRARSRV